MLREVRHRPRSEIIELELVSNHLVVFFDNLGLLLGRWQFFCCQVKAFLRIIFVLLADGCDCCLAALFLNFFDICKGIFVQIFRNRGCFNLAFDNLRYWDNLGLNFSEVEWNCLSDLFKLLFFLCRIFRLSRS